MPLVVRFTPDFTSSWVIRELTLVTAADLEFRFTLNVTLPHHLLPLCADVVPGPSWEDWLLKETGDLEGMYTREHPERFCLVSRPVLPQFLDKASLGVWGSDILCLVC